ncbi:MAG: CheR family methyltransferase [Nitrospinota bacterium]
MKATDQEFKKVREYVYKVCGIILTEDKRYLVEQRLEPVIKGLGMGGFHEFAAKVENSNDFLLRNTIIEAITTNETSFFRDGHPFETFRDFLLPKLGQLIQDRKGRLGGGKAGIWCAASSTGQEPYSLAMLVHEYAKAQAHLGISLDNFSILATDISSEVLEKAVSAKYTQLEVSRGLSRDKREENFEQNGNYWVLKESIRNLVQFKRLNITEPFQNLGMFDLIFCRNMLIYFDDETKKRIFYQFRKMLPETGVLVLGACENLNHITADFKSFYHKKTILYSVQ